MVGLDIGYKILSLSLSLNVYLVVTFKAKGGSVVGRWAWLQTWGGCAVDRLLLNRCKFCEFIYRLYLFIFIRLAYPIPQSYPLLLFQWDLPHRRKHHGASYYFAPRKKRVGAPGQLKEQLRSVSFNFHISENLLHLRLITHMTTNIYFFIIIFLLIFPIL